MHIRWEMTGLRIHFVCVRVVCRVCGCPLPRLAQQSKQPDKTEDRKISSRKILKFRPEHLTQPCTPPPGLRRRPLTPLPSRVGIGQILCASRSFCTLSAQPYRYYLMRDG
uniref:Putative secreted protein n=1 Tax=Anopheles triannulatus TaxID=58253 RepID=A0A2M4B431_9DIPT